MHIKFYYAAGANCCERVRWALDYKGIAYELVTLDADTPASALAAISPFGRVPVMELDGAPLTESMAMVELLEELSPPNPLNYATPFARAQVREICEAVNASIHPVQNSSVVNYFHPSWDKAQMRATRARWISTNLSKLAPRLWRSSGFAVGVQFTLADIFVAAIYRKGVALGMSAATDPGYEAHWQFLMAHPAIRQSCPLPDRRDNG
jgi:glutathione S-transferase